MRRLSAIHLTFVTTAFVLLALSIAGLAQPVDPRQPAQSSDEDEPPPGGCNPIGLTASGETVFPMTCKGFIERHKALDRNPGAAEAKPTAAEDRKAGAGEATAAATRPATSEEQKAVSNQAAGGPIETSHSAAGPATTASVPKQARKRIVGPPDCTKFRTYDATSGTYRAYNGDRRQCREGETTPPVK